MRLLDTAWELPGRSKRGAFDGKSGDSDVVSLVVVATRGVGHDKMLAQAECMIKPRWQAGCKSISNDCSFAVGENLKRKKRGGTFGIGINELVRPQRSAALTMPRRPGILRDPGSPPQGSPAILAGLISNELTGLPFQYFAFSEAWLTLVMCVEGPPAKLCLRACMCVSVHMSMHATVCVSVCVRACMLHLYGIRSVFHSIKPWPVTGCRHTTLQVLNLGDNNIRGLCKISGLRGEETIAAQHGIVSLARCLQHHNTITVRALNRLQALWVSGGALSMEAR